jgi:alpha-galactosidase
MGWDSWDTFGCSVTEQGVKQVATWMIATGMRDAGYRYVIVDDCWYDPNRTANGSLQANPTTFPDGMRALGDWLHARGLLFGIYESPQAKTCSQENNFYPGATGSLGHEQQDADTFASWGVDYLKYDWCSASGSLQDQIAAFTKMRDALRATGRPIVYSINPNSFHTPTGTAYDWGRIANLVRTGLDLAPLWDTGTYSNWMFGVANSIAVDTPLALRAGPGHWNDPDMLVVGQTVEQFVTATGANGLQNLLQPPLGTADNALSLTAMQTNLTMWAMLAAPLVLGDQVRYLTPAVAQILVNPSVIAVDQDPLGRQGAPISPNNWVWSKQLSGGSVAVALFNPGAVPTWEPANASEFHLPAASSYIVNNLWTGREWRGNGAFWANVPAQGAALFRVTAVPKPPPPKPKPKHGGSSKSQPGSGGSPGSGGVTVGGHSG